MNDIIKIVQALEGSNVFLEGVTKKKHKNKIGRFLGMLL